MDNKDNKTENIKTDAHKLQKKPSFMDKVREIDAADKKAELEEEAKLAEEREKRRQEQRKAYEDKLRQERLDIMKRKQGLAVEEAPQPEPEEQRTYTFFEKLSNAFYHDKPYIILGVMFGALAIFLIIDFITKERPDLQAMYIAYDYEMSYYASEVTPIWNEYCQDYNKDHKNIARLYYIPAGYADNDQASIYFAQSDRTKLIGEFQSGTTVMVIGDKTAYQEIGVLEDVFADCRELFPDDPYAEELGYRLAGTDLCKAIGMEDFDDSQLYVSFRKPMKTMSMSEEKMRVNYDHAVEFWRSFIADHRIDGLELAPTEDPPPLPPSEYDYDY